ncbi:1-phosphofructokinase family hexose kinase [Chitinophagaceae bacterium LB-8]|uniref:1-phosphofructokinase family hexose kinase n=1 Tax=Paraflavisolibacter caeni TaxID=2982496 RepID=A0A9X2XV77_9BACT|nr:1-phosphofructokinase family hexose kinase [Paraflavisolibacter caeni]MCU7549162.1 1-phosphofructokinase family hexose kinase [Paraflavisolibacter caeni]
MSKILTVTFNPAIDKSTTIESLAPEKKLRCSAPNFEPGGGGINVARAIKKLGGDAKAIFPAGGHTGIFLTELLVKEGVPVQSIKVQSFTRENLIVLDTSNNQQYRFGMPGSVILEEEWKQCLDLIEKEEDAEFVVASGSLPPGVPTDIYAQIAATCKKKGAKLIVDTSGEALLQAANEGVFLLKPNLAELSSLVGKKEINAELVDDVAREIINKGLCEIIIASLGPLGAVLITKDKEIHATPPVVKKRSTVGAGDSMVAGIVLSLSKGWDVGQALRYGVACGTAATMNHGTELCRLKDADRLYKLIRVAR